MSEARSNTAASVRSPARTEPRNPRRRTPARVRITRRPGNHSPDTTGAHGGGSRRKRILVALTGTVADRLTLERAFALAHEMDARVVGLIIGPRLPLAAATVGEVEDALQHGMQLFESLKTPALQQAAAHAVQLDMCFRHGPFVRTLLHEANDGQFDLVVIGRGRGASRWLGALRASMLIRHLPCSLLIAR
jgi:nucleotide-binding universal stress UspA family protein